MAKRHDIFYPDRVVNGAFVTRAVRELMREFEDQQVEVCIRPRRARTSLPQHRYYRGVVVAMLVQEMRNQGVQGLHGGPITGEQVHQMMAMKFLRDSVCINEETGECIDVVKSTADLTTAEMAQFVDWVRDWAYEVFGLEIPDPKAIGDASLAPP